MCSLVQCSLNGGSLAHICELCIIMYTREFMRRAF